MTDARPWTKLYPSGVPANINPDAYSTLVDLIEQTFQKYKSIPAFSCMGKEITFGEVDKLSREFGAYLQSRGLEPGDRIALMMPNLLQYPIALFGALRAGLIVVNTNPLYTPREMLHQFCDSEAKAIVIAENFASNLQKIIGQTSIKVVITTSIGEMLGMVKGTIVDFMVRHVKKMIPAYTLTNTIAFKDALSQGKKFTLKKHQGAGSDVVILQYTGGTTGVSKGVMLTNRNLVSNMQQIRATMMPFLTEAKEIGLCPLPLYHIFAFTVHCLALMTIGSLTVLVVNPKELSQVKNEFKRYKVTLMTGVNTLFNALINKPSFAELDFSSLKATVGGGMAVQRTVAERWEDITRCPLAEGYGLTETSPVVSVNPINGSGRLGTIGLPLPSTDVRIVDETGKVLDFDEVGEIQVKGPQVMLGYYKQVAATQEILSEDGWLSTGDIGKILPDGFVQIVDRKKDMILVSGFNVYPNEIEDVLASHPQVLEAAALGVPDEKSGEVPKVFIVLKPNASISKEEILSFCRENLTGYKIPKYIEFRKELPKTNVGKILRRALREGQA